MYCIGVKSIFTNNFKRKIRTDKDYLDEGHVDATIIVA